MNHQVGGVLTAGTAGKHLQMNHLLSVLRAVLLMGEKRKKKEKKKMKIKMNAPFVLGFALLSVIVQMVCMIYPKTIGFFATTGYMSWNSPLDYFRLVSHVLGHAGWGHLMSNMMLFLLIGPLLENKHGSMELLVMIAFTAVITGLVNNVFFNVGVTGASGIVFMMIILSSIVNIREGEIPLTFIIIMVLYIGSEVMNIIHDDNISQASHIIGGFVGGVFGFSIASNK